MFDNTPLTPFSIKVVNKLLYHQRRVRTPLVRKEDAPQRLLTYRELCEMLDRDPRQASTLTGPLACIEKWCAVNDWPNLSSIVVSESTGQPGKHYGKHAPRDNWHSDAIECLRSTDYPMFVN
ncbi:hypothetical protein ACI3L3_09190 [Desulfobaculum sp. SPO524]|uniref:hypothetical protein n=1 Tax=Desulfobaculum sp. SPO524 TaxID=3378071 RepID=UPI0038529AAF